MIPIVHLKETPVAINYVYRNCLQIKVKEIFICKPKVLCTKNCRFQWIGQARFTSGQK